MCDVSFVLSECSKGFISSVVKRGRDVYTTEIFYFAHWYVCTGISILEAEKVM